MRRLKVIVNNASELQPIFSGIHSNFFLQFYTFKQFSQLYIQTIFSVIYIQTIAFTKKGKCKVNHSLDKKKEAVEEALNNFTNLL